jgi:hypothetical protein
MQNPEEQVQCDLIRRQIEHEDSLVVNRLSWLMGSQSFLFTAYAIVVNGPVVPRTAAFTAKQDHLLTVVPLLGIACCLFIYAGILGAALVMRRLRAEFSSRVHRTPHMPIQGSAATRILGMAAPMLLPLLFGAAWLYLMLR